MKTPSSEVANISGGGIVRVVPYTHEPFTELGEEKNRTGRREAIIEAEADMGKGYPLIRGGERIMTGEKIVSVSPANKEEVVGYVSKADKELAEKAMQNADKNFAWWRRSDPE